MKVVHIQPSAGRTPTSWLIFGAVALIIGLTATVIPNSTSVELLRIENHQLKERKTRALSRGLSSSVSWNDELSGETQQAESELDTLFPDELSQLDTYETLRLAAAWNGLELADLNVGEAEPISSATESLPLVSSKASLRGRATLTKLQDFVSDLRGLGIPLTVQSFELTSETSDGADLVFSLRLAVYHKLSKFTEEASPRNQP